MVEVKKVKCMEMCKSFDCGLLKCKNVLVYWICFFVYLGDWCKIGFDLYVDKLYRNIGWRVGIIGVDESRKYFKCFGIYCNFLIGVEYYFLDKRINKCIEWVVMEWKDIWGRLKFYYIVGVGFDYLSECGKCID